MNLQFIFCRLPQLSLHYTYTMYNSPPRAVRILIVLNIKPHVFQEHPGMFNCHLMADLQPYLGGPLPVQNMCSSHRVCFTAITASEVLQSMDMCWPSRATAAPGQCWCGWKRAKWRQGEGIFEWGGWPRIRSAGHSYAGWIPTPAWAALFEWLIFAPTKLCV